MLFSVNRYKGNLYVDYFDIKYFETQQGMTMHTFNPGTQKGKGKRMSVNSHWLSLDTSFQARQRHRVKPLSKTKKQIIQNSKKAKVSTAS